MSEALVKEIMPWDELLKNGPFFFLLVVLILSIIRGTGTALTFLAKEALIPLRDVVLQHFSELQNHFERVDKHMTAATEHMKETSGTLRTIAEKLERERING